MTALWWWIAAGQMDRYLASILELESQCDLAANGHPYRLDFRLKPASEFFASKIAEKGIQWPNIAIELDGHEFHEKTREQVALRNKRDRDLQHDGWKVFHYSFLEVVRDPVACVTEVSRHGRRIYWDAERQFLEASTVEEQAEFLFAR